MAGTMKIIKRVYLLYVLLGYLCLSGCHRPLGHDQYRANQEEKAFMQEPLRDGTDVFFILFDQKIIEAPKQVPESFYIKGVIEGGEFNPKSDILGVGELAKEGRYGWLELLSKEFYPMESDKKAVTPFVKGYMVGKGFVPSMREVFKEP
jgi:hypothetical protein